MSETPESSQSQFPKFAIAVVIIILVAVGLFAGVYATTQQAGIAQFPSIVLSVCIPPIAIPGVAGLYLLVTSRNKPSNGNNS